MLRVLIVGGGIIGLLCAIECVDRGFAVTLVDQGPLPNPDATSHDRSRVLRALHPGDAIATGVAVAAHAAWSTVESRLGMHCYHPVGALSMGAPDRIDTDLATLAEAGASAEGLTPTELQHRWPHLMFPAGLAGVLERDAGVLLADRILTAAVAWLRGRSNVLLYPGNRVTRVDAGTRSATFADGSMVHGDRLLLAAGPWSRRLLPTALAQRLVLYRQTMLYCSVPDRTQWTNTPAVPAFGTEFGAWLVPPVDAVPLKLSSHEACQAVPEITDHAAGPVRIDGLTTRFRALVRGFDPSWITSAHDCYYLDDPATEGPSLIELGAGVLALAACGGAAFKLAPLIAAEITARFADEKGDRQRDQLRRPAFSRQ